MSKTVGTNQRTAYTVSHFRDNLEQIYLIAPESYEEFRIEPERIKTLEGFSEIHSNSEMSLLLATELYLPRYRSAGRNVCEYGEPGTILTHSGHEELGHTTAEIIKHLEIDREDAEKVSIGNYCYLLFR